MTISVISNVLLFLLSLGGAAAATEVDHPERMICRDKCLSQQPLEDTERQQCLGLCEDYAKARRPRQQAEDPVGQMEHCKHECRTGDDAGDDGDGRGMIGVVKVVKTKKAREDICEQWCWDSAPGGVAEMECLKECFEVYGVNG